MSTNTNTATPTKPAAAAPLTLKQRLLAILKSDAAQTENTPAYLLAVKAEDLITGDVADDLDEAAEWLTETADPEKYGTNGELGGVSVWRDAAGELAIKWTTDYDCTWCTVGLLVDVADGLGQNGFGFWDWFQDDWIETDNSDFAGFIVAEADDGLIFGFGLTEAEAWENSEEWLPDGADMENIEIFPATAAALHVVREYGADAAPCLDRVPYAGDFYYRELTDAVREQLWREAQREAEEAERKAAFAKFATVAVPNLKSCV